MLSKINNERIAHNFLFLLLTLVVPFVGFCLKDTSIAFIGIGLSTITKLLLTCDIRLFLTDLMLPFIVTRGPFTFEQFPTTLVLLYVLMILSILLIPFKNRVLNGKKKLNKGMLFNSFLVMGIVLFLSPIVRNIFYNEPAFPDHQGAYNIVYGYIGGIGALLLPLLMVLISTYKTDDKSPIPDLMYAFGLFLLLELGYTMFIEKVPFHEALTFSGIGWCNKNSYMIIFELTLPFMAYIFSKNFKRVDTLLVLLLSIILGLASDSRAGQITLIVGVPFLICLLVPRVKQYKVFMVLAFIATYAIQIAAVYFIPALNESIKRLFDSIFNNDSVTDILTGRDIFWQWINDYVFHNPKHLMFGGSFSYLFEMNQAFINGTEINMWLAHNSFMTFLAIGGVLGLCSLILHYIDVTFHIFKQKNTSKLLIFTFVLIGLIHGLGDNTFYNIQFMLPYIFVLQDAS